MLYVAIVNQLINYLVELSMQYGDVFIRTACFITFFECLLMKNQ